MRHNNNTEHHHKHFSDKDSERKSYDNLRDKGLSTQQYITELMFRREFFDYMQKYYQILPILINKKKIKRFINEIEINKKYSDHIQKWENLSKDEKVRLIQVELLVFKA